MHFHKLSLKVSLLFICLIASAETVYSQKTTKIFVQGKPVLYKARQNANLTRSIGCTRADNRTIDGTCNNLSNTTSCDFGATDINLERLFPAAYTDGLNTLAGANRPNPRTISNIVASQSGSIPSPRNLSSFVFTWGQFIDHDITLTPENDAEHADITVPPDEPMFISPIGFKRSITNPQTGNTTPREQVNIITAWIDASNVYGSDQARANWLRTFQGGKLWTSAGELLPYNTTNKEASGSIDSNAPSMAGGNLGATVTFVAGDVRAAEQPGLTALHTLFVREHNRICDKLASTDMSDEQIYQLARKHVGGLLQHITFNEFLPALGVSLGNYAGYDPSINPNIFSEFSAAAYRIGHTMVTDDMLFVDNNGAATTVPLLACFFNPTVIANHGIDPVLRGLAQQAQEAVDPFVVDGLRNFLFPIPGSATAFGLDLASLNIQRGRDHGLPDFMTVRNSMFCDVLISFSEINPDPVISARLTEAYDSNVYNLDLWVGLLSEKRLSNSSFGPTLHSIIKKQFGALRDGDYYYWENDPKLPSDIKNEIRITTLKNVILRNTDIQSLQADIFKN